MNKNYTLSRFACKRMPTRVVKIGDLEIGGNNPIAVQSMTNTKTMDVEASVKQCIELAEAGCQIIRLTAQNIQAAQALEHISKKFKAAGFNNPLVADIHFLPQAAMTAVEFVEKIRVNPGNYTDKKFTKLEYTDLEYEEELEKLREGFLPLLRRAKELGRALRIGTNHGSLSNRILTRYADTPLGMVEAALEFVRICEAENFKNVVLSFKASNTRVMTQAYRLASQKMQEEGFDCPLHLGVTEAGFGVDARIKSAMGIGGLLLDGLGDTIRVSLTEDPVEEVPEGIELVKFIEKFRNNQESKSIEEKLDVYSYSKRESYTLDLGNLKVGGNSSHAVAEFAEESPAEINFNSENIAKLGEDFAIKTYTIADKETLVADLNSGKKLALNISIADLEAGLIEVLQNACLETFALIAPKPTENRHYVGECRYLVALLEKFGVKCPIFLMLSKEYFTETEPDKMLNEASIYLGSLLADGIGDIELINIYPDAKDDVKMCLAILQGARARKSKAEYIACPSCGRTLYNIQETAKKIEEKTSHLKDITIGIMGCIVNGPGEMADADFGYVGGAVGKINLYKGQTCVEVNIPQEQAIEKLLELISKYHDISK